MNWFKRTKAGYIEDLDWIAATAKRFQGILDSEPDDAEAIKHSVAEEMADARPGYMDRQEMHWVLERRKGSIIELTARSSGDPDNLYQSRWTGQVMGYERYAYLTMTLLPNRDIAVSVSSELASLQRARVGSFTVRARDDLAKRLGLWAPHIYD